MRVITELASDTKSKEGDRELEEKEERTHYLSTSGSQATNTKHTIHVAEIWTMSQTLRSPDPGQGKNRPRKDFARKKRKQTKED